MNRLFRWNSSGITNLGYFIHLYIGIHWIPLESLQEMNFFQRNSFGNTKLKYLLHFMHSSSSLYWYSLDFPTYDQSFFSISDLALRVRTYLRQDFECAQLRNQATTNDTVWASGCRYLELSFPPPIQPLVPALLKNDATFEDPLGYRNPVRTLRVSFGRKNGYDSVSVWRHANLPLTSKIRDR